MRPLTLLGVGLLAAVAWAAETPAAPRDEPAMRGLLDAFWDGFLRHDAAALRECVDFPLTLMEQSPDGRVGERYVFSQRDWPAIARLFGQPSEEPVDAKLDGLRLEWLGEETCLARYDLAAEVGGEPVGGAFVTIFVWRDGWRVAVSSIPM